MNANPRPTCLTWYALYLHGPSCHILSIFTSLYNGKHHSPNTYLFDSPVVEHIHLQANPDHLVADANEYDLINIHGISGRVSGDRKIPTSFKSQTTGQLLWLTLALRSEGSDLQIFRLGMCALLCPFSVSFCVLLLWFHVIV